MEISLTPSNLIAELNGKLSKAWKTDGIDTNSLPSFSAAVVAGILNSSDDWIDVIRDRSLKSLHNSSHTEGRRIAQALVAVAVLQVFNDSVKLLVDLLSDGVAIPGSKVVNHDTDLRAEFVAAVLKKITPSVLGNYAQDIHKSVAQLPDLKALAEELSGQEGGTTQQGNIFSPALNTFCVAQNSMTLATHLRALTDSVNYLGTSFVAGRSSGEARLSSPSCSGEHLMFSLVNGRLQVKDFSSTNGTYVAREGIYVERVEPEAMLTAGDVVILSPSRVADGRIVGEPAAMVRVRAGSKINAQLGKGAPWSDILGAALQHRLNASARVGVNSAPLTIGPSPSGFGDKQVEIRNDLLLAAVKIGFRAPGHWSLQISATSNANNVIVTDAENQEIDVRTAKTREVELKSGCTIAIKTTDSRMVRFTL